MPSYADMHMHASFGPDPCRLAVELAERDIAAFSSTVTPFEYLRDANRLATCENVRLGVGMHPWWVGTSGLESVDETLMLFLDALEDTRYVGEVGLDFLERHVHTRDMQVVVFARIASLCAERGDRLVSIHCVKAEDELLDILGASGCAESCTCVLHSFGGSSEHLRAALDLGCLFSVGPRMLATKRGREYARVIPEASLLLETDYPEQDGAHARAQEIEETLEGVLRRLAEIRGCDASELGRSVFQRSASLLALP